MPKSKKLNKLTSVPDADHIPYLSLIILAAAFTILLVTLRRL